MSKATWRLQGALTEDSLAKLTAGMLRAVQVPGSAVVPAPLVRALCSPAAHLAVLDLTACSGLAGVRLDAVLTAAVVAQLAPTVQRLSFEDCKVTGSIPPGLEDCTRMETLNLSGNFKLNGPLPGAVFAAMPGLKALWLAANGFAGPVPPELAKCTKLETLDLSANQLDDTSFPAAVLAALPLLTHKRI